MTLTGAPLLVLLVSLALAAFAVIVAMSRLRWRLVAAATCLILTTLAWGASENDQFGYDRSWAALFGHDKQPDLLASIHVHLAPTAPVGGLAWPQVAAARGAAGTRGVLLAVDFVGGTSGIDRSGYVYLPPQYLQPAYAHTTFPVLELISGSPGAPRNWLAQLDIAGEMDHLIRDHRVGPMILVIPAPNGHLVQSEECVNAVNGKQDDTYLTTDVRSDVLASFRASTARAGWALAGYSTGGFCAVNLLTRHADLYSAATSMDGYFHALNDHYTGDLYHGDQALRLANSPDYVWAHTPPTPHVALLLLAGGDDVSATAATVQFHDELVSEPPVVRNGDTVEIGIHAKSGHSFTAWRADLPTVLSWTSQHLAPPTATPSPVVPPTVTVTGVPAPTWSPPASAPLPMVLRGQPFAAPTAR